HKTHANIDWINDWRYTPAKILIGLEAIKQPSIEGWFNACNGKRMENLLGDRMPEVLQDLRKEYDGKNPIGDVLTHRAANCMLPEKYKHGKNELRRFQQPSFSSTYQALS